MIYKLFSQRRKEEALAGKDDVYQYDNIPTHLRHQINSISFESLGIPYVISYNVEENPAWVEVERVFLREKGYVTLSREDTAGQRIPNYMIGADTDEWIDLLELICLVIDHLKSKNDAHLGKWQIQEESAKAIDEINYRMKQAGVGYAFENGQIIRIDSQFVHSQIVKPALGLLSAQGYDGPSEEYRTAHEHYRSGDYRQAVGMAANALESTFKAIFDQAGWEYKKGARISDLIKVAKGNELWPNYLDNSFDQLVATLQSGLPKIRDNDASHGQGATAKEVPSYVAAYALHLAASKIVFVVQAFEHRKLT